MSRITALIAMAVSVACGPTAPGPVPQVVGTGVWASDTADVVNSIVEELRGQGLDAAAAERFGGASFSTGMQRVALPSNPPDSIYLYVYRTAAQAADEASRIGSDGNVRPAEGYPHVHADYVGRQHFYYRDRVIAQHGGCDAAVRAVMERLFGPPVVVTQRLC